MMELPRLRYWRHRRVLTVRELAAKAGVAFATISRIENGQRAEARTIRKLAVALDIEPAELMEPEGEQGKEKAAA
jgi:transcriptional regulator with XRE-family HTH domain